MEKKIELIPGTRVTIETSENGSTISLYEKEETPSYQFKDGDFVRSISGNGREWFYIYKFIDDLDGINYYAAASPDFKCIRGYNEYGIGTYRSHKDARLMTDEEKARFIELLKMDGKRWYAEKKKTVSIQPEFKDGDFICAEYLTGKCVGIIRGFYKGENERVNLYCGDFIEYFSIGDKACIGNAGDRFDRVPTDLEKSALLLKLEERGLKWDKEIKKLVPIQPEFKVGDVVSLNDGKSLFVFIITNVSDSNCIGITARGTTIEAEKRLCSLVTSEKEEKFAKEFSENNFTWNPVLKKVEKIKWIPKHGDHYYYVSSYGEILETIYDEDCEADKIRISIGNFFKRHIQAISASRKFKKLFAEIQAELYK